MRLIWDSANGTFSAGRNAGKRALGKGRQRVKKRKALQRLRRATGGRQVRPHRSGAGYRP